MSSKSERPISAFFLSEEALAVYEDLTSLPYLYDETVVDCITTRYKDDLIYTWAGPILVAVNPVKTIQSLYSPAKINQTFELVKDGNDQLEPHVFTVAGLSHRRLISEIGLVNQAILVSGESGAGKTESAKFLLTYLTQVGSKKEASPLKEIWSGKKPEDIQKRILASNPILEAFGNASTLRNHNSSRFGKLIRLQYNGSHVKGANIDTYLLEKSRVAHQPERERNFHIFYQLLSGIRHGYLPDLELHSNDDCFAIISGYTDLQRERDLAAFEETVKAFNEIGVSTSAQKEIFQVVAAVICLGDIFFEFNNNEETWVVSSSQVCRAALSKASHLLGITVETLSEALTTKKILVTSGKETTVFNKVCEREDECKARRDSLMQLLYSSLFAHLVDAINAKISLRSTSWTAYLGILDIYGFEAFEENSLEQLCINYANERLQQEFTSRYIASEHRLLVEEGFMEFPFTYSDNKKCVSVLDSPVSVFAILNEECQLRKAVDEDETCARVCNALQNTGIVTPAPVSHRPFGFVIRHYAGEVTYTSTGLLLKNKDEVPQDIIGVLAESTNTFVANLRVGMEEKTSEKQAKRGKRKVTTLSKFKSSLDSLMKILTQCDLHYVRCLKPNFSLVAGSPDKPFLLDQLKSNGILETVKISQAGYPVRMLYDDFVKRYNFHHPVTIYDEKELTFMILTEVVGSNESGSPPEDKCRFGKTRIFVSESCLHKLEEMRQFQKNLAAICIQKNFKRFIVQKMYKTVVKSILILQRAARAWLCRLHYLKRKRSAVLIQRNVRCVLQKKKFKKTIHSVTVIQRHWRGWLCRRRYTLLKSTCQLAASTRSASRLSFVSSGLESAPFVSFTDHSVSDAESGATEDVLRTGLRLLETEESGIETDTESLSGEGHKAGRASRFKTRHDYSCLRKGTKISDDDINETAAAADLPGNRVPCGTRFLMSSRAGGVLKTSNKSKPQRVSEVLKVVPLEKEFKREGKKLRQSDSMLKFSQIIKARSTLKGFLIRLSTSDIPLFYKDGVLSHRHLSKGRVKFHTRLTCLPYSTAIPISEKPQGLADAFR